MAFNINKFVKPASTASAEDAINAYMSDPAARKKPSSIAAARKHEAVAVAVGMAMAAKPAAAGARKPVPVVEAPDRELARELELELASEARGLSSANEAAFFEGSLDDDDIGEYGEDLDDDLVDAPDDIVVPAVTPAVTPAPAVAPAVTPAPAMAPAPSDDDDVDSDETDSDGGDEIKQATSTEDAIIELMQKMIGADRAAVVRNYALALDDCVKRYGDMGEQLARERMELESGVAKHNDSYANDKARVLRQLERADDAAGRALRAKLASIELYHTEHVKDMEKENAELARREAEYSDIEKLRQLHVQLLGSAPAPTPARARARSSVMPRLANVPPFDTTVGPVHPGTIADILADAKKKADLGFFNETSHTFDLTVFLIDSTGMRVDELVHPRWAHLKQTSEQGPPLPLPNAVKVPADIRAAVMANAGSRKPKVVLFHLCRLPQDRKLVVVLLSTTLRAAVFIAHSAYREADWAGGDWRVYVLTGAHRMCKAACEALFGTYDGWWRQRVVVAEPPAKRAKINP